MPNQNVKPLLALLLLVSTFATARAELADRDQPIHVEAETTSTDTRNSRNVLQGNVTVVQGSLQMKADKATIWEDKTGNQYLEAEGKPVQFKQKLEGGGMLEARSDRAEYDGAKGDLRLIGHAYLKRINDEATGERIFYNAQTEEYRVEGGKDASGKPGRVKMTIIPKKNNPTTPGAKP